MVFLSRTIMLEVWLLIILHCNAQFVWADKNWHGSSPVEISLGWYLCGRVNPSAFLSVSENQYCPWDDSNVGLIVNAPVSSYDNFIRPLTAASSAPPSSRRSMVWCPWLYTRGYFLELLNTFCLQHRHKSLVVGVFTAVTCAWWCSLTPACPGQNIHSSLWSGCRAHCDISLDFPFYFSHFEESSSRLWKWLVMCLAVTSRGNPVENVYHCFRTPRHSGHDDLRCGTVFMDIVAHCFTMKFHLISLWWPHKPCTPWNPVGFCFLQREVWPLHPHLANTSYSWLCPPNLSA